jgi:hypothetical protein
MARGCDGRFKKGENKNKPEANSYGQKDLERLAEKAKTHKGL